VTNLAMKTTMISTIKSRAGIVCWGSVLTHAQCAPQAFWVTADVPHRSTREYRHTEHGLAACRQENGGTRPTNQLRQRHSQNDTVMCCAVSREQQPHCALLLVPLPLLHLTIRLQLQRV
jgi:hypothetical protein